MKLTKHVLRKAARRVLERRGNEVTPKPGAGIVPGARLTAKKSGSKPRTVSVRTSLVRELGLMRNEQGRGEQSARSTRCLSPFPQ